MRPLSPEATSVRPRLSGVTGAASAVTFASAAPGVTVGACHILAGTSSWADRSLVSEATFYPSRSLNAAERLAYYAHRLPLTEVATTYRFPPTPEVCKRWASITPEGFTMDLRAWSLLSGAPTWPESLWPDLQRYVKPPRRETTKLYRAHLPPDVVDECWDRFAHAIRPLQELGRLGAVIARFPSWFKPRPTSWEELAGLPARFPGARVAVELSSPRWFERDACEETLALLEQIGLALVVQAGPGRYHPVVAATADLALIRFRGRDWAPWEDGGVPAAEPGRRGPIALPQDDAAWWSYRYSEEELAAWVHRARELASGTRELHAIMDNCWRSDAVDNAVTFLDLLAAS